MTTPSEIATIVRFSRLASSHCLGPFIETSMSLRRASAADKALLTRDAVLRLSTSSDDISTISESSLPQSTSLISLPGLIELWLRAAASADSPSTSSAVSDARRWSVAHHYLQSNWASHRRTCRSCSTSLPVFAIEMFTTVSGGHDDALWASSGQSAPFEIARRKIDWHQVIDVIQFLQPVDGGIADDDGDDAGELERETFAVVGDPARWTDADEDDVAETSGTRERANLDGDVVDFSTPAAAAAAASSAGRFRPWIPSQDRDTDTPSPPPVPPPPATWEGVQAIVDRALANAQRTIMQGVGAISGAPASASSSESGEIVPKERLFRLKACSFWFCTGHCSKGALCNFSHVLLPGMEMPGPPPLGTRVGPTGYVPINMLFRTKPCKFFFSKGYCLKNEKCNFSHDPHALLPDGKLSPPLDDSC